MVILLLAGLASSPGSVTAPASAQTPAEPPSAEVELPAGPGEADRDAAAAAFEAGERLYGEGSYEAAIEQFRRAYSLVPDPAPLYNIARCYENLGEVAFALQFFEQYLAESPRAADRAEVARRLANLRLRPVRLFVSSAPSGATVLADGARAEQTTPAVVRLAPGPHVLVVRAAGYIPRTLRLRLAPARDSTAHVVLEASASDDDADRDEDADADGGDPAAARATDADRRHRRATDASSDESTRRIAGRRQTDGAFDLVLGAIAGTTRVGAGDLQLDVGLQVGVQWRWLLLVASLERLVLEDARSVALLELGYAARVDALDLVGFLGGGATDANAPEGGADGLVSFGVRAELYVERWWTVGACARFLVRKPFGDARQVWSTFGVLTAVRL